MLGELQGHFGTSGSNYLCMPGELQYMLSYRSGTQSHSEIHGTEYASPVAGTQNHNVPCAVCFTSTRDGVLMIPARTSWTAMTLNIIFIMP